MCPGSLTVKYPGRRGSPGASPRGRPGGTEKLHAHRGPQTGPGCRLHEVWACRLSRSPPICAVLPGTGKHWVLKRKGLRRGPGG